MYCSASNGALVQRRAEYRPSDLSIGITRSSVLMLSILVGIVALEIPH